MPQLSTARATADRRSTFVMILVCTALLGTALLAAGCGDEMEATAAVAPPITGLENAYDAAAAPKLPPTAPEDSEGLHNVYKLSKSIISGSEPIGEGAIKHLAEMGVKTILSVDGKAPDADTARKYGMRYVHVPIRYSGMTKDEVKKITKTFRDLEGPFFVHCFHGRHRGPAAAALGRVAIDGVPREQAMAEMRQYCGTASKYEGLYRTIAEAIVPDSNELARYQWDFPEGHTFKGIRQVMVPMARAHDDIKLLMDRDWEPDPAHPDIDALNSAKILLDLYIQANHLGDTAERSSEYKTWMTEGEQSMRGLVDSLEAMKAGDTSKGAAAAKQFKAVRKNCSVCHTAYRNQ